MNCSFYHENSKIFNNIAIKYYFNCVQYEIFSLITKGWGGNIQYPGWYWVDNVDHWIFNGSDSGLSKIQVQIEFCKQRQIHKYWLLGAHSLSKLFRGVYIVVGDFCNRLQRLHRCTICPGAFACLHHVPNNFCIRHQDSRAASRSEVSWK